MMGNDTEKSVLSFAASSNLVLHIKSTSAGLNVSHVLDAQRLSVLFFWPWGSLLGCKPLRNSIYICWPRNLFIPELLVGVPFFFVIVLLSYRVASRLCVWRKWYIWCQMINIHHISLVSTGAAVRIMVSVKQWLHCQRHINHPSVNIPHVINLQATH